MCNARAAVRPLVVTQPSLENTVNAPHRILVLIGLLLGLLTACAERPEAQPVPAPADCLAAQDDEGLVKAQAQAKVASGRERASAWVAVGHELVRIARTRMTPELYRNVDACVDRALAAATDDADALHLRGLVLMDAHHFADARALAQKLIARDADDVAAWGLLSDAALELGSLDEATTAAQRMLDLKPSILSYGRAAHLRFLAGDIPGALELYSLAIASGRPLRDREPSAWMMVEAARVFLHKGDYAGADAGFDAALRELPGYAPALAGKRQVADVRATKASL